jgi:hypothetical protein
MPYLAKIFFLRSRVHTVNQGELRAALEAVTRFRVFALRADAAPLAEYARGTAAYAQRLAEVASALGLKESAATASKALEHAAAALGKAPTAAEADPEVVRCRLEDEDREIKSILRDLGLQGSPVLESTKRIRAALAKAMLSDSVERQGTRHLHPSPMLPNAVYDPSKYLGDV